MLTHYLPSAAVTIVALLVYFVLGTNVARARGRYQVAAPAVDGHPDFARIYRVQQNPMTEAAIDPGLTRDLYVSLGEPVDGGAWIVRVYYKPFVDWIWGGCVLMALGGLLAATDRRYRATRRALEGTDASSLVGQRA